MGHGDDPFTRDAPLEGVCPAARLALYPRVGTAFRCYGQPPASSQSRGGVAVPRCPEKRNWNGLQRSSSAARPGRTLIWAAGAVDHERYRPDPQAIRRARRSSPRRALPACDTASRLSRSGGGRASRRASTPRARPVARLGLGWRVDIGTCHDTPRRARASREFPCAGDPLRISVSLLERSEGASPHHAANDGALGNLEKSPASAASRNAAATSTPSTRRSASTVGARSGREAASTTLRSSSLLASPQRSAASV